VPNLILYFDDTGSRFPDHQPALARQDTMDCFGLGGILFGSEQVRRIQELHRTFCQRWNIISPLHSNEIRTEKGNFSWLGRVAPMIRQAFHEDLAHLIGTLPVLVIACVVDRRGYNDRYFELYRDKRWMLCKTAFAILLERAAKFADHSAQQLEVYFEACGKKEDRDIIGYQRAIKRDGMPFDANRSTKYAPLAAADFRRILLGDPKRRSKDVPMCQIADLVLYPVAKGGYAPEYLPLRHLRNSGKLIDSHVSSERIDELGIKYFCFDNRSS
jgi:hypothetical protein